MSANNELIYFYALQRIAKEYMTTEQLQRRAEKEYGVSYHEALEMAYDNMQGCAADAIRGKRRPKEPMKAALASEIQATKDNLKHIEEMDKCES